MALRDRTARPATAAGYTLIEVLASVAVIVMVVLSSSSLLTNGIKAMRMAGDDGKARAAAIGEYERWRAMSWDTLEGTVGVAVGNSVKIGINTFTSGLENIPGATGMVYLANVDWSGDNLPDAVQITVSVSVYGTSNVLAWDWLAPLRWDSTAYASGGGGGGGGDYGGGGIGPPPNTGTLRSIWRVSGFIPNAGWN